nr:sugar ABC transporter permease [uncultured Oscillibacter sp.]
MEKETRGTVLSVSKQWWLKVNRRPVRLHPLDGAEFPHIVKIRYTAEGRDYTCRKWTGAGVRPPEAGDPVTVFYREGRPSKGRTELF